jgi:hypothetical protein
VRLDFSLRGAPGSVEVAVEPNTDPEALGCPTFAGGFPVCTASVTYAEKGLQGRPRMGATRLFHR